MIFLCIDTSNFIQCCLLELEGDDKSAIKGLLDVLDSDKATLLLPEVIELEFENKLRSKTEILRNKIGEHKEQINTDNLLDDKIKKEMIESLTRIMESREKNTDDVLKEINKIFAHKNTIKISLTQPIFLESYKSYLSGKKPNKVGKYPISSDSIIIQSLKSQLSDLDSYELIICSGNYKDFAEESRESTGGVGSKKIHSDIASLFKDVRYYMNIGELLNEKFDSRISGGVIEKMKEKESSLEIDNVDDSVYDLVGKTFPHKEADKTLDTKESKKTKNHL